MIPRSIVRRKCRIQFFLYEAPFSRESNLKTRVAWDYCSKYSANVGDMDPCPKMSQNSRITYSYFLQSEIPFEENFIQHYPIISDMTKDLIILRGKLNCTVKGR